MYKVAFNTLGCKVNQYETQAIKALFLKEGFIPVGFDEHADVYIINTCTVTSISDRKSRQMIRKAAKFNPDAVVVATGCYSQTAPKEVAEIQGVDLVIGTSDRGSMVEQVLNKLEGNNEKIIQVNDIMKVRTFEPLEIDDYEERTRVYVKIQDGCNNFCSYCKIPYARGPVRSRPLKDIKEEANRLAKAGFKEIVLTGIHLGSYGKDFKETSLLDAIKAVHEVEGIRRIRLGSLEPTNLTDDFVGEIARLDKVCPHFHVSMQSGCDETLKRMNRKYTAMEYRQGVERLKEAIEDVGITTDVIVGFPGETDEEFKETLEFCREMEFSSMHVFKFSPRTGTLAAKMDMQIAPETKDARSEMMIDLAMEMQKKFMDKMLNRRWEVLVDRETRDGMYEGHSANYVKFIFPSKEDVKGKFVNLVARSIGVDCLIGSLN